MLTFGWLNNKLADQAVHEMTQALKFKIIEPPADTFYGQRRLLLQDPSGT